MKIHKSNKHVLIIILILILAFTSACGSSSNEDAENSLPPVEGDQIEATDYSDSANWALLPKDEEPSDADVFCLYPTTYDGSDGEIATIDNEAMRSGADNFMKTKASAFETSGNIYAPYYRQLEAGWLLTLPAEEQDQYINGVPATDVVAAFEYYIENHNDGKPFILAGHSQGSTMVRTLLFGYLKENPDVYERMVAAYVTGYYVTEEELKEHDHLKFAEGEDDTGVIISYNTVSKDTDLNGLTVWKEGAISINPISWTRTDKTAPASDNLGSYVEVDDGVYKKVDNLADATVDTENGVVICDSLTAEQQKEYAMPEEAEAIFSNGSYHGNDISFYYYNLRNNAEKRVAAYFK